MRTLARISGGFAARAALAAATALAVLPPATARAADPVSGRDLASGCQVCHGIDGRGTNPMIPNIGGQSAQYLVKQLEDFRAGRRADPQMTLIAEGLDDAMIADLAAWYASVDARFTPPE